MLCCGVKCGAVMCSVAQWGDGNRMSCCVVARGVVWCCGVRWCGVEEIRCCEVECRVVRGCGVLEIREGQGKCRRRGHCPARRACIGAECLCGGGWMRWPSMEGVSREGISLLLFWLCPLIQANCCDGAAVRDAVALLHFRDFEDCRLTGIRDSDPGDHIGLVAAREFSC
jgi:hypothetical protein